MHRRELILAGAGLAAVGLVGASPAAAAPSYSTSDWMSHISNNTPLWKLTIPGTHDTCALYGGDSTQCQTTSVTAQLQAGYRFLDIRCRAHEGSFYIHHGSFYQQVAFDDVLVACRKFLAAHPGETILMRVKQEYSEVSDSQFGAIFKDYLDKRGWRSLFRLDSRLPLLGDVRGKIVLIGNNGGLPGIRWGGPLLDIQDEWVVPTLAHRGRKYQQVLDQLNRAMTNSTGKLFINFCSGSSSGCYPYSVASYVNPRVRDYLTGLGSHLPLGVVVTDFSDYYTPTLTRMLVDWNTQR